MKYAAVHQVKIGGRGGPRVEPKKDGVYIGETGRSLAKRSREHMTGLEKGEKENFIEKH